MVLSEVLLNVTSAPRSLVATEVTVASVVIDKLTSVAAKNSAVSENGVLFHNIFMACMYRSEKII